MSRLVPYLAEAAIERDSVALLTEYARARGVPIAPPVPIDDIVEKHLKLCIEFDDTVPHSAESGGRRRHSWCDFFRRGSNRGRRELGPGRNAGD